MLQLSKRPSVIYVLTNWAVQRVKTLARMTLSFEWTLVTSLHWRNGLDVDEQIVTTGAHSMTGKHYFGQVDACGPCSTTRNCDVPYLHDGPE